VARPVPPPAAPGSPPGGGGSRLCRPLCPAAAAGIHWEEKPRRLRPVATPPPPHLRTGSWARGAWEVAKAHSAWRKPQAGSLKLRRPPQSVPRPGTLRMQGCRLPLGASPRDACAAAWSPGVWYVWPISAPLEWARGPELTSGASLPNVPRSGPKRRCRQRAPAGGGQVGEGGERGSASAHCLRGRCVWGHILCPTRIQPHNVVERKRSLQIRQPVPC
jgi:hypothetical protein